MGLCCVEQVLHLGTSGLEPARSGTPEGYIGEFLLLDHPLAVKTQLRLQSHFHLEPARWLPLASWRWRKLRQDKELRRQSMPD